MSETTMKIIIFGFMGIGFLLGRDMTSSIIGAAIGGILVVSIGHLRQKNKLIYKLTGVNILSHKKIEYLQKLI